MHWISIGLMDGFGTLLRAFRKTNLVANRRAGRL
jgi:hypothetical protein